MRKKYKSTETEMVELFDFLKNASAVALFDTLHRIEDEGQGKEAVEELEGQFREELERSGTSASQSVLKAVDEIAAVAIFCSMMRRMQKRAESE